MIINRILFIRPGIRSIKTAFSQPLGILYLISSLRRKFPGKFEIKILEQRLHNLGIDQITEEIKKFRPDVIGISCMSMEANEALKIVKIAKKINERCIIVFGGPHASMFYEDILKNKEIDFLITGEGEETFLELIEKLLNNESVESVSGLSFYKNNKKITTPSRNLIENLDEIPFPAWDLIDFKRYSKQMSMNVYCHSVPWAVIFTSRGCPYQCAYCHNIFGKRTRFRSPENVVDEIELLTTKYGIKEIQIVDDVFNLDLARAKKICDLIIERNIKIKISFPNGLRGDIMDRELIQKLKKAGCYSITYAIEAASPRIQKLINRNLDLKKISEAIAWSYEEKIPVRGFFMIGFPSETPEEIEETIKFALNSDILIPIFLTVVVYPKTRLMELAKKVYFDIDFNDWKWDSKNFHYRAKQTFYEKVTGIDLFKTQISAYRRFYFRPKKIFLILRYLPKNYTIIYFIFMFFITTKLWHISIRQNKIIK